MTPGGISSEYREPHPIERVGTKALIPGFSRECLEDGRALRQSRCGAFAIGIMADGRERKVYYHCKDRLCSACARRYQHRVYRSLQARLGEGVHAWRMVTLTKPDARTLDQTRESLDELRLAWRRLRALRAKAKLPPLNGVVVTEVTTGGRGGPPHPHAHLHVLLPFDDAADVAETWRATVSRIVGRPVENLSAAAHYPRRAEHRDGEQAASYLAGYCSVPVEVQHELCVRQQHALAQQMKGLRRYDGIGTLRGLDLRAEAQEGAEPIVAVRAPDGYTVDACLWFAGRAGGTLYQQTTEEGQWRMESSMAHPCRGMPRPDSARPLRMRRA